MENTGVTEQNDPRSSDLNESDLNDTRNEASPTLIYENDSELSILGSSYRVPDMPKKHIEPIVLDTSLSYIPVYAHLKMCDLKSIERPATPPILAELRIKCQNDVDSCVSSKASPSTGRMSKKRASFTLKSRESETTGKMEYQDQ